jgi:hypothetical protein
VAALVALASFTASTGARAAVSDDAVLATQSCRVGVQRPTRIVFTCADVGAYIDHLRWTTWSGRVAIGSGSFHYNDCDPSCAGGHFHSLAARIRLYRRRACPERTHLYYRDATLITPGNASASVSPAPRRPFRSSPIAPFAQVAERRPRKSAVERGASIVGGWLLSKRVRLRTAWTSICGRAEAVAASGHVRRRDAVTRSIKADDGVLLCGRVPLGTPAVATVLADRSTRSKLPGPSRGGAQRAKDQPLVD